MAEEKPTQVNLLTKQCELLFIGLSKTSKELLSILAEQSSEELSINQASEKVVILKKEFVDSFSALPFVCDTQEETVALKITLRDLYSLRFDSFITRCNSFVDERISRLPETLEKGIALIRYLANAKTELLLLLS